MQQSRIWHWCGFAFEFGWGMWMPETNEVYTFPRAILIKFSSPISHSLWWQKLWCSRELTPLQSFIKSIVESAMWWNKLCWFWVAHEKLAHFPQWCSHRVDGVFARIIKRCTRWNTQLFVEFSEFYAVTECLIT